MARNQFFVAPAPFRTIAESLAQSSAFLKDIQRILELDEDTFGRLATELARNKSFLDESEVERIVRSVVVQDSDALATTIHRLGCLIHGAEIGAVDATNVLGAAIEETESSLEKPQRQQLVTRIRKLVVEPIGIAKQHKADELVHAIGARLEGFRFICDIRPIFDREHSRVDGAIPLTVLRIEYRKTDGFSDAIELHLTEQQIASMGARVEDAQAKLRMIKELLSANRIAMPKTGSSGEEA